MTTRSPHHPRIGVIIAAAGSGERLGGDVPKAWRRLGAMPLVERAWRSFCPTVLQSAGQEWMVSWIGLAVDAAGERRADPYRNDAPVDLAVVRGGATRTESVANVLNAMPSEIDLVVVHDAARPFWPVDRWDELLGEAWKWDGAILAIPVADTLKRAEIGGMTTVDRSDLWAAQTPQAFRAEMLRRAHTQARANGWEATDDADLVRRVGGAVKFVLSTPRNFKITTRLDWDMAQLMAEGGSRSPLLRVGYGYDTHRLGGDGPLVLGGVRLAETGGLIGHSDGDALLHAICDALLGAVALGDIGVHFPPGDPAYKGCDSRILLRATRSLLAGQGYVPVQVDATVLAEAPRLSPHASEMRRLIADDLGVTVGMVSVKATTSEGMGFVGRGEGIAVQAVATVASQTEDFS